jgi:hypothetical protein
LTELGVGSLMILIGWALDVLREGDSVAQRRTGLIV